jgi:sugar lactone lactonase YvrE
MVGLLATTAGCSTFGISPTAGTSAAGRTARITTTDIYAFAPDRALVALYALDEKRDRAPIALLKGKSTQLSLGNGMAVDTDGTLYALVYDSTSSTAPIKLLAFAPNAHGNAKPERTAILKGPILAGYATGLALDGHGNFWIAAIGKLLRYPTSATGTVSPNASIKVQLDTSTGVLAANSSNVTVDSAGNIYCVAVVVQQSQHATGVSEYSFKSRHHAKLVRSFYDPELPEVPPGSIAVDPSGTIYLASSLPNTGVFAYAPSTQSGLVYYSRRFTSGNGTSVASLATDATGKVYVAAGSRILEFGANANGRVRPLRTVVDPAHLNYTTNDYGTLLNVITSQR